MSGKPCPFVFYRPLTGKPERFSDRKRALARAAEVARLDCCAVPVWTRQSIAVGWGSYVGDVYHLIRVVKPGEARGDA